jgi:hypothetical protein
MPGSDRGGACPAVFRHCRGNQVHWVTCRRTPLAIPAMLPVLTEITVNGKTRTIAWTDETVQLKDYGAARQITRSEHGQRVLQVLTSGFDACPAGLLGWLKSRWREEHFLKYAAASYVLSLRRPEDPCRSGRGRTHAPCVTAEHPDLPRFVCCPG